jgi:hypothetical protein
MLRLTIALERDLRAGLTMAARSPNPTLAVWADRFMATLGDRPRPRFDSAMKQLTLWTTLRDGQIGPWLGRIDSDWRFTCLTYKCSGMSARECVRRQLVTETERTKDTERGQASRYPACKTGACRQGTEIRAALKIQNGWIGSRRRRHHNGNRDRVRMG